MDFITVLVMVALVATVAVLFIGIGSMARGGEFDRQNSVRLMFTRVWFQSATIILIIIAVILAARLA